MIPRSDQTAACQNRYPSIPSATEQRHAHATIEPLVDMPRLVPTKFSQAGCHSKLVHILKRLHLLRRFLCLNDSRVDRFCYSGVRIRTSLCKRPLAWTLQPSWMSEDLVENFAQPQAC